MASRASLHVAFDGPALLLSSCTHADYTVTDVCSIDVNCLSYTYRNYNCLVYVKFYKSNCLSGPAFFIR